MNGLVQKRIKEKKLEKFIETPGFVHNTRNCHFGVFFELSKKPEPESLGWTGRLF